MTYRTNHQIAAAEAPPIAAVWSWLEGREFPADRPLLDVAQALPSYPPAGALTDHLKDCLDQPATARYTDIIGLAELRAALGADIGESHAGRIAADRVLITAGCNQAFCVALMALAQAGDEVILPVPYYFNHQMWLDMLGIRARHLAFRPDRGGVPDPADAARLIGPATRAIVLVSPNNPTGVILPPDVIEAFFDLARDRGVALVLDETYKDFLATDGPPHALFQRPDWPETLIQLYSFSKVYSLAGYRVGSLIGGPAVTVPATKIMDTMQISAPHIGQQAALYGLRHLADWRAEKRRLMLDRVAALRAAFETVPTGYSLVSAGAFFAYIGHPFGATPSVEVARRLAERQNLLCLPGAAFGPDQDGYLRFAFGNIAAEDMPDLVTRLAASERN